jgi:hypothetical protein
MPARSPLLLLLAALGACSGPDHSTAGAALPSDVPNREVHPAAQVAPPPVSADCANPQVVCPSGTHCGAIDDSAVEFVCGTYSVAPLGACTSSTECTPGPDSEGDFNFGACRMGVCVRVTAQGCASTAECLPGLTCAPNNAGKSVCGRHDIPEHGSCPFTDGPFAPCAAGLTCVGNRVNPGICVPQRLPGERCTLTADCQPFVTCEAPAAGSEGRCVLPSGQACSGDDQCATGTTCGRPDPSAPTVCGSFAGTAGTACRVTADCVPGLTCDGGSEAECGHHTIAAGLPCARTADCGGGLVCVVDAHQNRVCVPSDTG